MTRTKTKIDVSRLYAALDGARRSKGLSWRQLAAEVGCSPSTMTRLANGDRPDVDAFLSLTKWLKMPGETFTTDNSPDPNQAGTEQPELLAEVSALLRARTDFGEEEKERLQEVFEAALRLNTARRADRRR
ncbi:MAG: helix-turn-helix domain-containing protein [Micromonosporaceae bacterium]